MDDDQQPTPLLAWEEPLQDAAPPDPAPTSAPAVAFLPPHPAQERLFDSVVYRPGALVAVALLACPAISAIVAAAVAGASGVLPIWLPLVLLLWLPALVVAWALLTSVRITPDALACGRPLRPWRVVRFDEIEYVGRRGPRWVVSARSGSPVTFTPLLLHRGSQLQRGLLLRLPLTVLAGDLRAEAQALADGSLTEAPTQSDVDGVLTAHSRLLWSALAGVSAVTLLALAALTLWLSVAPLTIVLAVALVALAGGFGFVALWIPQEIFVSEKGLLINFRLLRRERDIFWTQVRLIEYTPWETALIFRSAHTRVCAGPGLLTTQQARLMRRYISRYCLTQVGPLMGPRPR